jgi:UDP-GlcNAc:undecaprenyl-phosphate GlcNAc-1-phosphate transferase
MQIGAGVACFFATLLAMLALRPVAVAVELVDKPGGRKTHRGDIPVVGGVAMFVGCIFGMGLLPTSAFVTVSLLSAAALVVLVGILDDRFEISPAARLTAHLAAALLVLATASDLTISTLGAPFGGEATRFSELGGAAFTCVAIVGAINAFNMLDGMDGLAGTLAFNALLTLIVLTAMTGDTVVGGLSIVLSGAVAAFLIFNIPAKYNRRFRCFMGDAGSTLLGFLLACMCISASQGIGPKVAPTTTLWIVAIPLYELLWTFTRRILNRASPFQPDRAHFHHKLLDAGFGVRGAFFVLICIGVTLSLVGICMHYFEVSDAFSFGLWLFSGVAMVVLMQNAAILWHIVPERFRRIRPAQPELDAA